MTFILTQVRMLLTLNGTYLYLIITMDNRLLSMNKNANVTIQIQIQIQIVY